MARSRAAVLNSQIKKLETKAKKKALKEQKEREIKALQAKRDSLRKKLSK